jgi:capsular exopolysaccharide synthesis family protein
MAMITSVTRNKPATERSPDRSANTASAGELAGYYAALLRLVQSQQAEHGLGSYAVGITSCNRGEGVTTLAANLAITAAHGGHRRVLLVDANARYAGVAKLFGITATAGLTDVLSGAGLLGDCVRQSPVEFLSVLPAGSPDKTLGSDFEVADVADLLDELKSEFELIVIDLPQAEELSECYAFAQVLDGTFLVVEAGRVDVRIARRVTQRFAHCQATLLGAIYNKQT